ncbi:MAG: rod shape-determining protein RodA [Candidatus Omnitrophica bacterium CG12_big_fil_rev_8_21_14_0_65_43_15]|uniref:Peptidoglycan glycosyltransferase RodA n=1 Tax=Candidatus Taenaricola geysiri TaxID=1974752 RepID=A0A2J0LFG6_9BACT|nr:MAG: rod shape-determining protein RodA [Candidatus Omnitrophica bacterium CG1_02_43_210]PIV11621.1 MAG: rod shape-determining protein RodA [Candidatus Omnitrophica bacterium CG03_land_8_20_14_0_80_43_22]PIW66595.1 MAG: rod shape-determining protein RodA [Candidatus Omnitrophica bacterium CG12_big_fil_rev_8_21_14_0_65_43_15]PIW80364.1 MAG: rod shape-determining protein RodA [Candidatus Omnitrophica bacterium CG_4_8_14_3_um_filter_43_15]PIY84144.1 MAG: rod shape-determining protein RodA [Cand
MFKKLDYQIIMLTLAIFIIGLMFQYSVSYQKDVAVWYNSAFKQLVWVLIGFFIFASILKIGYRRIISVSYYFYIVVVILLIVVLVFGRERLGAQRWIQIGAFNLQPSEFSKLALILTLSYYLGRRKDSVLRLKSFLVPCFLTALPAIFILKQPDLGTALLLFPTLLGMLYIFGIKIKYIISFILAGVLSLPVMWNFLRPYQQQRLLVFINPNMDPLGAGYTIIQSKIAVGSGRLFGKGWLSGTQNYLNFLPERHTDFIFSVVGEEWGFFGSVVILILYYLLVRRMLHILDITENVYGRLLIAGVATIISLQVIINIGMTIGLFPVVGITLPLISYGGSSLLTTFIGVALVLSVNQLR